MLTKTLNKICEVCNQNCKQTAKVELLNCPKFSPCPEVTISKLGIIRWKNPRGHRDNHTYTLGGRRLSQQERQEGIENRQSLAADRDFHLHKQPNQNLAPRSPKVGGNTQKAKGNKIKAICPVCLVNLAAGKHHIKPLSQGGLDTPKNKVGLCLNCHNIVEAYADNCIYYSPDLVRKIQLEHNYRAY